MLALPLVRLRSSQDLTLNSNVSLLLQTVAHCLQPGVPADVQCCAATVGNTCSHVHISQGLCGAQAWPVAAAVAELCNRQWSANRPQSRRSLCCVQAKQKDTCQVSNVSDLPVDLVLSTRDVGFQLQFKYAPSCVLKPHDKHVHNDDGYMSSAGCLQMLRSAIFWSWPSSMLTDLLKCRRASALQQ